MLTNSFPLAGCTTSFQMDSDAVAGGNSYGDNGRGQMRLHPWHDPVFISYHDVFTARKRRDSGAQPRHQGPNPIQQDQPCRGKFDPMPVVLYQLFGSGVRLQGWGR